MDYKNRLLIIDDEAQARRIVQRTLEPEGYELNFAENGEAGLALARDIIPDLILSDVKMPPGIDGFEVCRRLRKESGLAEVPIILITSLDDRSSRLQGIDAGADDFLIKPFDRTELRVRVRAITRLNRYRRLLAERGKFEWVVEQADEGYIAVDGEGRISYANACARRYFNLPEQGPLNDEFLSVAAEQYRLHPETAWKDWPAAFAAPRYLVRPETQTERALWLLTNSLYFPEGISGGILVHLRDVSDQMNLQRLTYTFETMVSHKMTTPLNGLGLLTLLKERAAGKLSAKETGILDAALESADRLRQNIREILAYMDPASVVKGNTAFKLNELEELFLEIARNLEVSAHASAHIQEIRQDARLPLSEEDLRVVFNNLLENTKKFHPQHTPATALAVLAGDSDTVTLRIEDDGLHLPPEELPKVWTPYYQNEKFFTGQVEGMGLGLSKVAEIIWSAGGDCHMSNRLNQPGVAVELHLPLVFDTSQ
ncbi:MAG: response regulator [Gammaproteobacteria bacterium]|nr:response regulator [Gammaproteobacteria bacterium]